MGGAENFSSQLLDWFRRRKVPVRAWTTFGPLNTRLNAMGIKSKKIPIIVDIIGDWKGLVKGAVLFPLAALYYGYLVFINRDSGVILVTGFIEKIVVTLWAKIFKVPIVWIEFGPLQTVFSKFWGLPKFLYRLASRYTDFVIEPSRNTEKNNKNIAGFKPGVTKVIPCGIGPLKKVSAIPEKFTAYCVSRMEQGKGQDLLISAWPKVVKKYPAAKLYFIGVGDFRPILEKQAADLGIKNSVVFLGWVKDLAKTAARFSVAIFPTIWPMEGMSLVFMEAMSINKPIICFKWGSNLELVNSGGALMVQKGNIQKLSKAIIYAFSHKDEMSRLARNSRRRFDLYFSLNVVGPKYEKVFLNAQNE